ncbi:MAG: flagellar biosynthesis protein FlhF [Planctomycetota bacterium]
MHIRTFRAANLQEALADIREQMGPSASVLHTRQIRHAWMGWLGRTQVEVTAGLRPGERPAENPQPPSRHSVIESATPTDARRLTSSSSVPPEAPTRQIGGALASRLLATGAHRDVAQRWLHSAASFATNMPDHEGAVDQRMSEYLQQAVSRELRLSGPIRTSPGDRHIVALVGPTGVGKTTTVAKLAAGFRIQARRRVGLLTIDTYRIAAVQQLRAYAEIMDLPMQVVEAPHQMDEAIEQLGDVDLVLIDTAGRNPNNDARVQQLNGFLRAARPDETHLVLSATSSADSIRVTLDGFAPVAATSVILTKLDEAPSTAAVLSALTQPERSLWTPLSYITNGQQVPDDIAVADAETLVRSLLPAQPSWLPDGSPYAAESYLLPDVA